MKTFTLLLLSILNAIPQAELPSPTLPDLPSPTLPNLPSPTLPNLPSPTLPYVPSPTLPGTITESAPPAVVSPAYGGSPTLVEVPSPTNPTLPSPTLANSPVVPVAVAAPVVDQSLYSGPATCIAALGTNQIPGGLTCHNTYNAGSPLAAGYGGCDLVKTSEGGILDLELVWAFAKSKNYLVKGTFSYSFRWW